MRARSRLLSGLLITATAVSTMGWGATAYAGDGRAPAPALTRVLPGGISTVDGPYGVAISPDGGRAYVAVNTSNVVDVVNTAANVITNTIPVGTSPYDVEVSPVGTSVYVTNRSASTVSVISTASNTVVATVPVGTSPYALAISPDGSRAYVASYGANAVSVIDTATNTVVDTVPVGSNPYGIAVSPDGSSVYVTNAGDNTVSVIDTVTDTVTGSIPVGQTPYAVTFSPDGTSVYVANNNSKTLSVIDPATETVTDTVTLTASPYDVTTAPDGGYVYLSGQNSVSVVDAAADTLVDTVSLPSNAFGIAVTPDGEHAYVSQYQGKSVVRLAAPDVPGAPTLVSAVAGAGDATVSWTAPTDNGGSTITDYTVTASSDGASATCASSPCTVPGLSNGTPYTFTVHATNGVGNSVESAASNSVTPLSVPGAPTGVTASVGAGQASVSWTAPTDDGGSAITGYTVTATDTTNPIDSGQTGSAAAGATSATVSDLTVGDWYTFTVHATNAAGNSAESDSTAAKVAADRPDTPGAVTAVAGDGSAVVSWPAPASDGGSPITSYTVSWFPVGSQVCASSPCTVTGLRNGTAYMFAVVATNAAGDSEQTALSNAVTPTASAGTGTGPGTGPGTAPGGSTGPSTGAQSGTGWYHDPLTKAKRHHLAPARPGREGGKVRQTKAAFRSHDGTLLVPAAKAHGHQLDKGQGVQLTGLFRFDSATLTKKGKHQLAKLAKSMEDVKAFTCEGYADYGGAVGHEQSLSQQRAQAVCQILTRKLGKHVQAKTAGFGSTRPVAVGGSTQSRTDNRRVDVLVRR